MCKDNVAVSPCNAHPDGCGFPGGCSGPPHVPPDEPRPDFMGFLRTVPTPFTRAEIQALRRRFYDLSAPGADFPFPRTPEERLYGQLAETLDLLDAVMCRDEEKVQGPECDETDELDEDWLKKLAEEFRRDSPPQGCPTCSRRPRPPRGPKLWPRRDFNEDARIGPC